ncbi:uncharacterized protein F4812DRAFT_202598 [Daldinia caldariorum]|uniref:uncharacterized protein n=1 Tax=Daldinia caldariorum TaxID=326644 RepID=UPI002008D250|nr:uncharacterized protein F4812DRAFT_202598 [Daldinia caldariorum]KAI1472024.1 hypothetical protein F4812DRAFT_202598 [Daldinia caldariorum]
MPRIKPVLPPPIPATVGLMEETGGMSILHPGYSNGYTPLLRFLTFRDEGVDYDMVYYAACIVAGNVWSDIPAPFLTKEADPGSPHVTRPDDGILRDNQYYFHVPKCEDPKYPITPSFGDWVFPHDNVPQIWRELVINQIPLAVRSRLPAVRHRFPAVIRDGSCRITQAVSALVAAHVVPIFETNWFIQNGMSRYNIDLTVVSMIDDAANLFALRGDVRWQFDQKHFTAMPKLVDNQYQLVGHMLQSSMSYMHEEEYLYHDRPFLQLNDVAREFLFARFAWSIFNDTTIPFFEVKGQPFTVRVRKEADSGPSVELAVHTVSSMTSLPSLRQGSSSKKRTRDEPAKEQHDDSDLFWSIEEGKMVNINQIDYPFGDPDFNSPKFYDSESDRPDKCERLE